MGDVVNLPVITSLDIPAQRVLQSALECGMDEVVVIGFDRDGNDYFASSRADAAPILYALERARHKLMRIIDERSGDDPA